MSLAPGTSIGRFRTIAAFGAGGLGEAYRALDTGVCSARAVASHGGLTAGAAPDAARRIR